METNSIVENGDKGESVNISLLHANAFGRSHLPRKKSDCFVTKLTNVLRSLRIVYNLPRYMFNNRSKRRHSTGRIYWPTEMKKFTAVTFFMHLYFVFALSHTGLYAWEIFLGYTSVSRDSTLENLKNVIYNSRYGFMLFKSTLLFLCYRVQSRKIFEVSGQVAQELQRCNGRKQVYVKTAVYVMVVVLLILSILWESMDWMAWGNGDTFYNTWQKDVPFIFVGGSLKLYIVLGFWYCFGSPLNICMNFGMIFFAALVMCLHARWKSMNQRLRCEQSYLLKSFEVDWDRIRQLAEKTDDVFSAMVFVAWVADIVCAVGYLGSVVIYGAGNHIEQAYTVCGLVIHAVWNPGCYLLPCIMFEEEMTRTQQIVIGVVSRLATDYQEIREINDARMHNLHLSLILQKVAYRPVAFTAWKFFYITRNVILTISTVLVSYALVLVQLVGRKQDMGSNNFIDTKLNASMLLAQT